jgi:hypothetical protein
VRWAAFDVTFPVDQDVLLQIEYDMFNELAIYGRPEFWFYRYCIYFGNRRRVIWKYLICRYYFTSPLFGIPAGHCNGKPRLCYLRQRNALEVKRKDFEPTREDNLTVGVIPSDIWQRSLYLRSLAKQRPDDADIWAGLGDRYMELGI